MEVVDSSSHLEISFSIAPPISFFPGKFDNHSRAPAGTGTGAAAESALNRIGLILSNDSPPPSPSPLTFTFFSFQFQEVKMCDHQRLNWERMLRISHSALHW
jgi:hypothetical protein